MAAITVERAQKILTELAMLAYRAVNADSKAHELQGKQVDVTIRGDIIAGEAVIKRILELRESFVIYTEEKGLLIPKGDPKYTIIFDDIDGSINFKEGRGMLPHGTILGMFDTAEPRFKDCIASVFLEFNSGNLFVAGRGSGSYLIEGFAENDSHSKVKIHTSGKTSMEDPGLLKIGLDRYLLGDLAEPLAEYDRYMTVFYRSKAVHIALISLGALDLDISPSKFIGKVSTEMRKMKAGIEEIAGGYLLIKEAGGEVFDWEGRDIGNQKIDLKSGNAPDFIMAATAPLGLELVKDMQSNSEIKYYMSITKRH